ncbi:EPIDERMAL PATTERNING FACTOR-like protein 6 [Linum grandiflorum]
MGSKKRNGSSSSSFRRRKSCRATASLCFFLCCISVFFLSSLSSLSLGIRCPSSAPADLCFQEYLENGMVVRRLLGGPGSSPPRCTWKCGKCTPCKPVHVSVPPGTPVTAEYYPEAWRCKCGNKLYMP